MTEQIDPTRSARPFPPSQTAETGDRKQLQSAKPAAEDRVSLGDQEQVGQTYGPGLKVATPYQLLRNLVVKTLQEQGLELQFETAAGEIDFNRMTAEEAQALVAEDGYFGVEETSQRVVDFTINAFGRDPEKLTEMKDAIDQGFLEAQDAFGGALPEISQHTYDAIMEKLDTFAGQFAESGE